MKRGSWSQGQRFLKAMPMFEPKIVAFCCNWCSYAGADLAGVSRYQYPPAVRIIRVMCSGRVEPVFIFDAFKYGADGVIITGCHPGECHYISGNQHAERRVENTKRALEYLGLGAERLRLEWISASEGQRFAEVMQEFTRKIKTLGPSPIKTGKAGYGKEGRNEVGCPKRKLQ